MAAGATTDADDLVRHRLADIDVETRRIADELDSGRTKLRADLASGVPIDADDEAELDRLAARGVEVADESRHLQRRLDDPPPDPEPHDHLSHRNLPIRTESRTRRRILSIWSAVSTPLIVGVVALLFLPGAATPIVGTIVAWLFILLAIEALARRNLFRFLSTLVVLTVLAAVVITVVGLLFVHGWQTTTAICLGVLAVVLLVVNLQELARD